MNNLPLLAVSASDGQPRAAAAVGANVTSPRPRAPAVRSDSRKRQKSGRESKVESIDLDREFCPRSAGMVVKDLASVQSTPTNSTGVAPLEDAHCADVAVLIPSNSELLGKRGSTGKPETEGRSVEGADFNLRLGKSIHAFVESDGSGHEVRGRLSSVKWSKYEPVITAICKLAEYLGGLREGEVKSVEWMHVEGVKGTPCMRFKLPSHCAGLVASERFQKAVQALTSELMTNKLPVTRDMFDEAPPVADSASLPPQVSLASDSMEPVEALPKEKIREIAQEIKARSGGSILPVPCSVDSPEWTNDVQIYGALGEKPKPKEVKGLVVLEECDVDGFRKASHVVHLLPNKLGAASVDVAFKEDVWLDLVKEFAATTGELFTAEYEEIHLGSKVTRILTKLARSTSHGLLANAGV